MVRRPSTRSSTKATRWIGLGRPGGLFVPHDDRDLLERPELAGDVARAGGDGRVAVVRGGEPADPDLGVDREVVERRRTHDAVDAGRPVLALLQVVPDDVRRPGRRARLRVGLLCVECRLRPLGDLELEAVRVEAGLVEGGADGRVEARVAELPRRDVPRDAHAPELRVALPDRRPTAGLAQHPRAARSMRNTAPVRAPGALAHDEPSSRPDPPGWTSSSDVTATAS